MDTMTFMDMVRHEVEQLKIHLTDEQKGKLDKATFKPTHSEHCVYGQITGDCFSHEAAKLVDACAVSIGVADCPLDVKSFDLPPSERGFFDGYAPIGFTPLEKYIYGSPKHNILEYLKGEADTLQLEKITP